MKRYCIWNNKGGVGKTFLTYLLATEYAKIHNDKEIIVVDMCPQANVSEILLGGNGKGQLNLEECFAKELTIASYIKRRFSESKNNLLGSETTYFIEVHDYNSHLPENLYLLPGDNELDICSNLISYLGLSPEKRAWLNSRYLLLDLIKSFANSRSRKKEQVYFFDCNPSFAPYTELAIIASERLIIPCTADNASIRGIHNIFKLLYGANQGAIEYTNFYDKVKEYNIALPIIHAVVQNKSRSHDKDASKVFKATLAEIENTITGLQAKYKDKFSDDHPPVYNIKDGNTLAAVINHTGKMLSDILAGPHTVYDMTTQINETQKNILIDDVRLLVKQL